jgi:hypothetical protein
MRRYGIETAVALFIVAYFTYNVANGITLAMIMRTIQ